MASSTDIADPAPMAQAAEGAPRSVCRLGAPLGEGPVWVARDRAIWFVDIIGHKLHRFDPATGALKSWDTPGPPGWILPSRDGRFVVGMQRGLNSFDPATGGFASLGAVEPDLPGNRLNDATVDPAGRIWFGSMDEAQAKPTGRVYVHAHGVTRDCGLAPVTITNGPAVSPDGRTLYHVDTLGQVIHEIPVHDDATLGTPRPFVRIEPGAGSPDGPTVDSEGCLWIGLYGGWAARRYAPDGALVQTVTFPVANVTKIAFGGADLRTAFATTARTGLDAAALAKQPAAGDLFAFRVDVPGLPVRTFEG